MIRIEGIGQGLAVWRDWAQAADDDELRLAFRAIIKECKIRAALRNTRLYSVPEAVEAMRRRGR